MARWEPGARERLEKAALELFAQVGFAEATVPEIAARAGLRARSFFRYFADKREVLFAGDADYIARVAGLVADAPHGAAPMELVASSLPTLAEEQFEGRRELLRTRHRIVAADAGLRERDLLKQALLVGTIEEGFRARGSDPLTAVLAAQCSVAVFGTALRRWLEAADDRPLAEHVTEVLAAFTALTGDPRSAPSGPAAPPGS